MYRTNLIDARKEINIVNRLFFRLPKYRLQARIKQLKGEWAYAWQDGNDIAIYFTVLYPDYNFFRNIVAHEMIHQWQYHHKLPHKHNKHFFSWQSAMENFGYEIKYRH